MITIANDHCVSSAKEMVVSMLFYLGYIVASLCPFDIIYETEIINHFKYKKCAKSERKTDAKQETALNINFYISEVKN
jgi:hypothetical protein